MTGLSTAQAAARPADNGRNAVASQRRMPLPARLLRQLIDPLVALLVAALVVTVLLHDLTDALVIALVIVVNTAIGIAQEVKAEHAIAALAALSAPTARLTRDGVDVVLPAAEVVVGDLVHVEAGDVVPADVRLTTAHQLRLDEAALTGESVPADRESGEEAFAGTVVVVGRGSGVVVRTGAASALGRIASLVAATRTGPTPMQRRLSSLGRVLGVTAVVLCAVVFALGLLSGRPVIAMAITAVSLVVAAVPESLPAVVTLALALGARRMADHRAIARQLPAVETLGSVTVVASDKTGTLTEGKMSVRRAVDAGGVRYQMVGEGYEPAGEVRGPGRLLDLPQYPLWNLPARAFCAPMPH